MAMTQGNLLFPSWLTGFSGIKMAEMIGKAEQDRATGKAGRSNRSCISRDGLGRALGIVEQPKSGEAELGGVGGAEGF